MTATSHPSALLFQALDEVQGIKDPLLRAQSATELMHAISSTSEELRDTRRLAIITLRDEGHTLNWIGDQLGGIGRSRVLQIINDMRRAKRPGVIETEVRLAVTELRGSGASDERVVEEVVPLLMSFRGGKRMPLERVAELLEVPDFWLAHRMPPEYVGGGEDTGKTEEQEPVKPARARARKAASA